MDTRMPLPPNPWTRRLRASRYETGDAGGLERRKPMLSLRLAGWFLLRLADRTLSGLLFQEPPRNARR